MCSGRIDPIIIIEAFEQGVDGVFIGGCHPGDCHYLEGNYNAAKKIKMTMELLGLTGLETGRLRLEWVSASEGQRFAEVMTEFTDEIKELGPSPLASDSPPEDLLRKLTAAKAAMSDFRLRSIMAKEYKIVDKDGNVYGEMKDQGEWDEFAQEALNTEFERKQILGLIKTDPLSVKDLAVKTEIPTHRTLSHIVTLRAKNLVALDSIEGLTPKYIALYAGGD